MEARTRQQIREVHGWSTLLEVQQWEWSWASFSSSFLSDIFQRFPSAPICCKYNGAINPRAQQKKKVSRAGICLRWQAISSINLAAPKQGLPNNFDPPLSKGIERALWETRRPSIPLCCFSEWPSHLLQKSIFGMQKYYP